MSGMSPRGSRAAGQAAMPHVWRPSRQLPPVHRFGRLLPFMARELDGQHDPSAGRRLLARRQGTGRRIHGEQTSVAHWRNVPSEWQASRRPHGEREDGSSTDPFVTWTTPSMPDRILRAGTLVAGRASRKSSARRYVLSGFRGGSHRMYFRKNAFTCAVEGCPNVGSSVAPCPVQRWQRCDTNRGLCQGALGPAAWHQRLR